MRRVLLTLGSLLALAALAGCRTPELASFKREVVVKKDAEGKVVETVITESVSQEYLTSKIYFQYAVPRQGDANFAPHGR